VLKSGDFKGKLGEVSLFYLGEERIALVGLGKEDAVSVEMVRRAFAAAVRLAQGKKYPTVNFVFPNVKRLEREEALRGFFEGISLTNYAFSQYKKDKAVVLKAAGLIGIDKKDLPLLEKLQAVISGVHFVRDLVNGNSDDKSPQVIGEVALAMEKRSGRVKTTLLDRKALEKEKMGLILAVNRGSSVEPCVAIVSYQGNPKSKDHVVLVGKGITYDTGGLNLKLADGMLTMKSDMAGAATVLETVRVAADLGLKVNVTAVAALAENSIDGKSFKPGDVYRSHSGKTVEITNTDAEGRLVLADAISYAVDHLKPSCVIDVGTLTGAIVIALGEEMAGLFTHDEKLADQLLAASKASGELFWRMPINQDYSDMLKSEIADLVNSAGREGGSIKCALFLQEFTKGVPWAHLDIAGPAFLTKPKHYNTAKGSGFGVRTLVEFLEGF